MKLLIGFAFFNLLFGAMFITSSQTIDKTTNQIIIYHPYVQLGYLFCIIGIIFQVIIIIYYLITEHKTSKKGQNYDE